MFKIGVYGSSESTVAEPAEKARAAGQRIAVTGNIIITGACGGVPFSAVQGAKSAGGYAMGFPAVCRGDGDYEARMGAPRGLCDELIFIPDDYPHRNDISVCRKYRNVASVAECDGAIFISGRWGTMNEFSNAYDMGKVIGVLTGTGGITAHIRGLVEAFDKETTFAIVYNDDPVALVDAVVALCKQATYPINDISGRAALGSCPASRNHYAKLKWQCRRGMRELDLLLERFLESRYDSLTDADRRRFSRFLEEPNRHLVAWLLENGEPPDIEYKGLVSQLQSYGKTPP